MSSIASACCLYIEGLWQDLISDACEFHVVSNWVKGSFSLACADGRGERGFSVV